jgi:hypothetical protein
LPTSSFDTFFACTIIVAAALIATGYLCSTMQVRIDNTQNINEQNYLQAIANHIVTDPGTPSNWGASGSNPTDFGLAASSSTLPYELDIDKVSRLDSLNNYFLSYFDMENSTSMNSLALGVAVSQFMDINIIQPTNVTTDNGILFTLGISTSIESQPVSASLNCYVVAENLVSDVTSSTSNVGVGQVTVQIPNMTSDNAIVIVFARANFDDRITSYAIYNLANSTQEISPISDVLTLSPLNYTLNLATNSSGVTIQNCYLFSYDHQENLEYISGTQQCPIPELVDNSPLIMAVDGVENGTYFQQWVSYPQVPFYTGSDFSGSGQNVFSYDVTINGVLYRLEISLGRPAS